MRHLIKRCFTILILLSDMSVPAFGSEALSGDVVRLDDGRSVHLMGIKASGVTARDYLQQLIEGKTLMIEAAKMDRYGRVDAYLYATNDHEKIWLQGEMLNAGMGFVYPPTGNEPRLSDLFLAEDAARNAKAGMWQEAGFSDLDAANPRSIRFGQFAMIRGTVTKAERIKNKFYLNFGDDWHKDFTIAIAAHDLRLFRAASIDPQTYQGKTIRVRGWIVHNFGPMINVTHPAQIEVLGEGTPKP